MRRATITAPRGLSRRRLLIRRPAAYALACSKSSCDCQAAWPYSCPRCVGRVRQPLAECLAHHSVRLAMGLPAAHCAREAHGEAHEPQACASKSRFLECIARAFIRCGCKLAPHRRLCSRTTPRNPPGLDIALPPLKPRLRYGSLYILFDGARAWCAVVRECDAGDAAPCRLQGSATRVCDGRPDAAAGEQAC